MRFYPKGEFSQNEVADSIKNNQILNHYASIVNGGLTGINFGPDSVRREQRGTEAFYSTEVFTGTSTINLTNAEINGGTYIIPQLDEVVSLEEGWVVGSINITYEKWGPTNNTTNDLPAGGTPNYSRWIVFLDGNVVAETDRVFTRFYTINLPFAFPTTAGEHRISVGVESVEFAETDNPTNNSRQLSIYNYHNIFRNIKR